MRNALFGTVVATGLIAPSLGHAQGVTPPQQQTTQELFLAPVHWAVGLNAAALLIYGYNGILTVPEVAGALLIGYIGGVGAAAWYAQRAEQPLMKPKT